MGDAGEDDALEVVEIFVSAAFGSALLAAQRIENAIRRIDTIEVLGDFAAEESTRSGVIRIALDLCGLPEVVHGNEHTACIGTIVRAGGVDGAGHGWLDCSGFRRDARNQTVESTANNALVSSAS